MKPKCRTCSPSLNLNFEELDYGDIKNELDAMIIDEEPKVDPAEPADLKSADGFQQSFSDPDGDYIFRTEKKVPDAHPEAG